MTAKKTVTSTPKIVVAKSAGFCFGVRRAITLAEETAAKKKKTIFTLGPLIHNPQEVRRLNRRGIRTVADARNLKKATLLLRTHGIPEGLREKLEKKRLTLVDATCPFVKRAQDIVRKLGGSESEIVIVGEKMHPEVKALVSYGQGKCRVIEHKNDLRGRRFAGPLAVVSQTTQTPENFSAVLKCLKKQCSPVTAYNTICRATIDRQTAASRLAKRADVMVVTGGKNSGNTRRLAEICGRYTRTYHIETAGEIKPAWFAGAKLVGLTAGASTPDWIINDVKLRIEDITEK
jgi:4-hydroxy-3-methylbut-2-enyl diphosphate reductase